VRILLLANNGVGLYRFRLELLQELLKRHEVYISLPRGPLVPELEKLGCRYVRTVLNRRGLNPLQDLFLLAAYVRMMCRLRPGLTLTYTVKPNVYGGLAARLCRVPQIANITGLGTAVENGGSLSRLVLRLHRLGLARARRVFFQNSRDMGLLVSRRVIMAPVSLIPGSGVNLAANPLAPYPDTAEGVRFLFIGRLMKDKGIEELLTAIAQVRESCGEARLLIVGEPDEGDMDRLNAMQVLGHLTFLGYRSDIHEQIAASHCVVLPSYHEGMSNVLLEAAAAGRPVIATRIPGCRETFDEGISGLGCELRDAESLRDAMLAFIRLPDEDKRAMGLAGRRKMEREFDRGIVVNAYMSEIENLEKELRT
jgi:glycosyltransferase involved in cell wall biosynthesis